MKGNGKVNLTGIGRIYRKQERSTFIDVPRSRFMEALEKLKRRGLTRISSITGYDSGNGFEVIYHFDSGGHLVNIKVKLPAAKPSIGTITKHFPGAELFERELMEMLGVKVEGHPNPEKLFLCEDSPKCPLRKALKGGNNG